MEEEGKHKSKCMAILKATLVANESPIQKMRTDMALTTTQCGTEMLEKLCLTKEQLGHVLSIRTSNEALAVLGTPVATYCNQLK